jgi:hypothetical protein
MMPFKNKGILRSRVNASIMVGRKHQEPESARPGLVPGYLDMLVTRALSRVIPGEYRITPPVFALLSANLVTIVFAIAGNWDAATVIFIYWAQSIIIGIFTIATIAGADTMAIKADMDARHRERGENITLDPRRVRKHQYLLAAFFFIHYGIFHLAYYDFIINEGIFGPVNFSDPGLFVSCGIFFATHLYSFLFYRTRERQGEEHVNDAFTDPYFRIIPMHLTIGFGAMIILLLGILGITSTLPVLVLFLLLKTAADLAMHLWKHAE